MPVFSPRRKQQVADILLANLCLVSTVVAWFAGAWLLSSLTDDQVALNALPLLAGSLAVTGVAMALLPDATWGSIGLGRAALPGAAGGLLLGAGAVALPVAASVGAGWAEWLPWDAAGVRFDWTDARLYGVALLVAGAFGEELFTRGIFLQFLARAVGPATAVAATSVAFALLHGANPGVTYLAQCNTALFGAVFGLAVTRHKSLWLAAGLHFGWNIGQVAAGANNSGITIRLTELHLDLRGAAWLTGGDYGLEGGAMATGAVLLLGAVVYLLPARSDAVRPLWQTVAASPDGAGGRPRDPLLGLPAESGGSVAACQDREADDGTAG